MILKTSVTPELQRALSQNFDRDIPFKPPKLTKKNNPLGRSFQPWQATQVGPYGCGGGRTSRSGPRPHLQCFTPLGFDSHTRTMQARLHSLHVSTFTTGIRLWV